MTACFNVRATVSQLQINGCREQRAYVQTIGLRVDEVARQSPWARTRAAA